MKLSELRKLNKARTQGEWDYCYDGSSDWSIGLKEDPQDLRICGVHRFQGNWNQGSANAAFIVAMANSAEKLLAVVAAVRKIRWGNAGMEKYDEWLGVHEAKAALAALESGEK